MKILLANKFFYPKGGDCVHTLGLKQLLENMGHEVAIFSMQHPQNLENEYKQFWPSRVEFTSTNSSAFIETIFRPVYSGEVKNKWNNLIEEFNPDVVHLQNIHSQLSPIIAKEAYQKGIPVFWTLHDFKLICPSYSMLRDGKPCEKCLSDKKNVIRYRCLKNSLAASTLAYIEALTWSKNKLEKYTTRFIAPSNFLKNKMVEAGFSENKIQQLYNFTEAEKFNPVEDKQNYYVYLGRLSEEKGIKTLLQAARDLPGYLLKIIGDGPLRKTLEKEFNNSHIQFLGYQPWEQIKTELGNAKFMVLPSECYENNPLSIIESFAVGTPVLGSDIGGIPELVEVGKNGELFHPADVSDLKLKIQKMMEVNNWNYQEISKNSKKKFNPECYYNVLKLCYSS